MAHYTDLITDKVQSLLSHDIWVMGSEASAWKLWQGMSLMMGVLLIIVGLSHLQILARLDKQSYPPIGASLIIMLMLTIVIYAGVHFFGGMQIYGGMAGLILQSICLLLTIRGMNRPSVS